MYLFLAPVFLDNFVVFSLCAEKCWRSEKPSGGVKKKGKEVRNTSKRLFD